MFLLLILVLMCEGAGWRNEAEVFVVKMWRLLIYVTEAKKTRHRQKTDAGTSVVLRVKLRIFTRLLAPEKNTNILNENALQNINGTIKEIRWKRESSSPWAVPPNIRGVARSKNVGWTHDERGARAYNGGLGAERGRGRAPGQGQTPLKLKTF